LFRYAVVTTTEARRERVLAATSAPLDGERQGRRTARAIIAATAIGAVGLGV